MRGSFRKYAAIALSTTALCLPGTVHAQSLGGDLIGTLPQPYLRSIITAGCSSSICWDSKGRIISAGSGGFVYPSAFGAKCDGRTDDAVQLQNMFDASAGKPIFIPSFCRTTVSLTLPANTWITGAGREVAGITITTCNPLFVNSSPTNVVITNIWMQGTDSCGPTWPSGNINAGFINVSGSGKTVTLQNDKMSGFNSNTWSEFTPFGAGLTDLTIKDNLFVTVQADIPTDATATNNQTILFYMFSGGGGSGGFVNNIVEDNRIEGTAICQGIDFYGNHQYFVASRNQINDIGGGNTNFLNHCGNGLGHNSYAILVYDAQGDGNPAQYGQITDNKIINVPSAGLYMVGAGVNTVSRSLVSGNQILNQYSQEDTSLLRGAIVLASYTDITAIGNEIWDSFGGIVSANSVGTDTIIGNTCKTTVASAASTPFCVYLVGEVNGTGGTDNHVVKTNTLETLGAGSVTIRTNTSSTNQLGFVDLINNTINSAVTGASFGSSYVSGLLTVSTNKFGGAGTAGSFTGITGNLYLSNNINLSFTAAGLPGSATTNGSSVFVSDGAPASSPCTGTSTGSTAFRQNGAWKCF
jgi:hypothetical protein